MAFLIKYKYQNINYFYIDLDFYETLSIPIVSYNKIHY